MNRKQIILVITVAIVVSSIAFEGGRQTAIVQRNRDAINQKQSAGFSHRASAPSTLVDEHKLLLRNIASVSFPELYDLLQSASPETRMDWAKQIEAMPAGPQKFGAIETFYKTLVQVDVRAASQLVLNLSDHRLQTIAVSAMIGAAPESAMSEMAATAIRVPRYYRGLEFDKALDDWSEVDPVAASRFVEEHPKDTSPLDIISTWAAIDPNAARTWLDRVLVERKDDEEHVAQAILGLCAGWREADTTGALNYAVAHADEERFGKAIQNLASSLFLDSPEQARTFIERLPNDQLKKAAVGEITTITTGVILGGSPDWPRPADVVAKWLVALPKEVWLEQIGSVTSQWANEDELGFRSWLNQLPNESRDQVIANYCESADTREPERAITIAMNISDEVLREKSLRELLKAFGSTKEQAIERLQTFNLQPATKRHLRQLLESDR